MAEHTPTPWTYERAKRPTDGEYDCAVAAVIDGKRHVIAETFGRVAADVRPDSEANAAFICKAVNSHDALVKALTKSRQWVEANTAQVRGVSAQAAAPGEAMLSEIDAALASIKETAK